MINMSLREFQGRSISGFKLTLWLSTHSTYSIDYQDRKKGKSQLEDFVFSPNETKTVGTVPTSTTTAEKSVA